MQRRMNRVRPGRARAIATRSGQGPRTGLRCGSGSPRNCPRGSAFSRTRARRSSIKTASNSRRFARPIKKATMPGIKSTNESAARLTQLAGQMRGQACGAISCPPPRGGVLFGFGVSPLRRSRRIPTGPMWAQHDPQNAAPLWASH